MNSRDSLLSQIDSILGSLASLRSAVLSLAAYQGEAKSNPVPVPLAGEPAPGSAPAEDEADDAMIPPTTKLRVAIIVGHEPKAPGAVNVTTKISEYVFNADLAARIARRIESDSEGWIVPVIVLRYPEGYHQLPAKVNALAPAFAIELHANASNGRASGIEMIAISEEGRRLGGELQARVVQALGLPDRGVKAPWAGRGEPLLRGTKCPCVIAESFFIDNDADLEIAMERRDLLAAAYTGGVIAYARDLWERGLWK